MANPTLLSIATTLALILAGRFVPVAQSADIVPAVLDARTLLLTGKHSEAADAYERLLKTEPVAATIGLARLSEAQGKTDAAIERLEAAQKESDKNLQILAELARLRFDRGDHEAAATLVEQALKVNADEPLARWVQAELHRTAGRLMEADRAYKWFVDYYNRQERIDDPDTLRLVGRATAQYARWNRLSDQFHFLVNELYPDIVELNEHYWPAHFEAGLLFLEKYNRGEASRSFNKALAINPNADEAHAALAALRATGLRAGAGETALGASTGNQP